YLCAYLRGGMRVVVDDYAPARVPERLEAPRRSAERVERIGRRRELDSAGGGRDHRGRRVERVVRAGQLRCDPGLARGTAQQERLPAGAVAALADPNVGAGAGPVAEPACGLQHAG